MSLGATMSAPASAWLAAVCASSFSDGSFRIFSGTGILPVCCCILELTGKMPVPLLTMPQWPCSMYSHRHTSVMTSSDGSSFFNSRVVCWTMPFFA